MQLQVKMNEESNGKLVLLLLPVQTLCQLHTSSVPSSYIRCFNNKQGSNCFSKEMYGRSIVKMNAWKSFYHYMILLKKTL